MSGTKNKDTSNDYKDTLFLPRTDFPMRAELAKREPDLIRFWEDSDIYGKLKRERAGREPFILHDGPPYANAPIHIGTALNKILKDTIIRYKWLRGYFSPYVPGFDTHGMPIEHRVLKDLGAVHGGIDPVTLREKCEEHARKYVRVQSDEFIRLGVMGDWKDPYITLTSDFEAAQLGMFAEMVERGYVYRGRKSVLWCTECQTALAAAEIEYEDDTAPSIYVAYKFQDAPKKFPELEGRDPEIIIWTTTTWTIPASMAVTVGPEYDYSFFESGSRVFLIATEMKDSVAASAGIEFGREILRVKGRDLENLCATHPYLDRKIQLCTADYVTLDSGTGCVHTAGGHGVEDFETCVRYGIEIYNPVDAKGVFVPETPLVGGLSLKDGEPVILKALTDGNRLLASVKMTHSYPHCWRCKKPVIFRATDQWFVDVSKFRDRALEVIDNEVKWIPAWGHDRIFNMVRDRSDWCISRQRNWGVPIPAFYCEDCGEVILTPDRIKAVAAKIAESGSNTWWASTPEQLLGDLAVCPKCGSRHIRKENDIMDVWFDSGSTHRGCLDNKDRWPELSWPCDLYLEGSDQHRGWFQSSLLTAVASRGRAPYKSVLTHGFIIDDKGRKMSKSLGNTIAPQEIVGKFGADILRLWVASTDYRSDISISMNIINNLSESYRRIRNTARFLLANLAGFDPSHDIVPNSELKGADAYVLTKLASLVERCTASFDEYEFHYPMSQIHRFCDQDMSSFYIDISKDKLYADAATSPSRMAARSVMWKVLRTLTVMISPVLAFTGEEIWQEMRKMDPTLSESVHMADWPTPDRDGLDGSVEAVWDRVMEARGAVTRVLEAARAAKMIGHALDASVVMSLGEKYADLKGALTDEEWETVCIVSKFKTADSVTGPSHIVTDEETGITVGVDKDDDPKCPRCWKHRHEIAEGHEVCRRCAEVLGR